MKAGQLTRRDRCYLLGRRASFLTGRKAAQAWRVLAHKVEAMGDMDMPKFMDLLVAIRTATIIGRRGRAGTAALVEGRGENARRSA